MKVRDHKKIFLSPSFSFPFSFLPLDNKRGKEREEVNDDKGNKDILLDFLGHSFSFFFPLFFSTAR